MAKKNDTDKLSELLASFNGDLLKEDTPQYFNDDSIRVERILLDMVRPDPIQPRRVLPEKIHLAFHENRLTPSQALREMVQIAQVAARQRGRPFSNLLELLPDPEREDEADVKLAPEEELLRELVNLAVTIRDDGQVNPITVIDVTEGVTRLYRVEGLLNAISEAAEWDEQLSEGKALSDREAAVLQSLEIMTRNADGAVWLKASELRERVREIMGISQDQMGHAQWIGHILNRLALTDRNRKKAYTGGQMYLIDRREVSDMMRRYDVSQIPTNLPEN